MDYNKSLRSSHAYIKVLKKQVYLRSLLKSYKTVFSIKSR